MMGKNIRFISFIIVAGLMQACAPRTIVLDEDFTLSRRNAVEVFHEVFDERNLADAVTGRARASISTPGSSDRATVEFISDRERTLIHFRNNLGMEGGRIFVDSDSITLYNRIDRYVQRIGTDDRDLMLRDGYYALNVMDILNPDLRTKSPRRVYEGDTTWLFVFSDQTSAVIDKKSRQIRRLELPVRNQAEFNTFRFDQFEPAGGFVLPRQIQILSEDKKSSIFLQVQSIHVNPPNLDFDLRLPSDLPIIRP